MQSGLQARHASHWKSQTDNKQPPPSVEFTQLPEMACDLGMETLLVLCQIFVPPFMQGGLHRGLWQQ